MSLVRAFLCFPSKAIIQSMFMVKYVSSLLWNLLNSLHYLLIRLLTVLVFALFQLL